MNGVVDAPFGDGIQRFRLTIGGAEELEEKCDSGLAEIAQRLAQQRWKTRDVRETIRLGLVGGGLPPTRALVLVDRYATQGLDALRVLALAILSPMIFGVPDDPPGKSGAGRKKRRAAPAATAAPASAPSTAPAP